MPVPFDSRKIYYRSPFGAVEQGTEIHFRILLPKTEHIQKAQLCVKYDYDYNWEFTELIWCGKFDEDTEIWECDFTPEKIGLYWYNFKLTGIDKTRYVIPSDPYKVSTIEDYMGISCIYLNPISEAYSNHRYDTGDYSKVDSILGTEEDFKHLCAEAKKRGIHIINDGVFSHTGSDSVYFNRSGRYGKGGAYNDKNSPYFSWYKFNEWPNNYQSWWGFDTLPEVIEETPSFNEYINGKDGIVKKWMKCGNSGWRLDVADELPDVFIENLRKSVKDENPDAFLVGEVWEDASNKESYGARRKFLLGEQFDSVMNYVFRDAILNFCKGQHGKYTMEQIMSVIENYPRPVLRVLMNSLSTHDTERAITVMAGEPLDGKDREWQADTKLDDEHKKLGVKLLKVASAMQFTLPGFPCIYYGDEAGMEGYRDPFNRCCYPWGKENKELIEWHKKLANVRKSCSALWDGDFINVLSEERRISYIRHDKDSAIFCTFNLYDYEVEAKMPPGYADGEPVFGSKLENGILTIPPMSAEFVVIELGT